MTNQIQVYEPDSHRKQGFFRSWFTMVRNLIQYRELIFQLFIRDFLGGFKKSLFGVGWLFISPILGVVSWVFYDSTGILEPGDVGVPYPAYVLLGSMIYGLFMGFYTAATGTIEAGGGFIMQVNYPHEIMLFKQVAQYLAGFTISFISNIVVLVVFGIMPSWHIILFPILVLPLFFLGSSIGLLVAVASVVSNDIRKAVDIGLGLVQVVTPIVYSADITDLTLLSLIKWNPLSYLIANVRDMIFFGKMNTPEGYWISSLISLLAFLFCWRLFYISEQRVIEKRLAL